MWPSPWRMATRSPTRTCWQLQLGKINTKGLWNSWNGAAMSIHMIRSDQYLGYSPASFLEPEFMNPGLILGLGGIVTWYGLPSLGLLFIMEVDMIKSLIMGSLKIQKSLGFSGVTFMEMRMWQSDKVLNGNVSKRLCQKELRIIT